MPDLSTTYLGLKLKNPLVASSGPLCKDVGSILKMEDAGAQIQPFPTVNAPDRFRLHGRFYRRSE